jgi:hypothetical protein
VGIGELKCPECGKLFPGAYMLDWHVRSVHRSHQDIEIDESTFVGIEIERYYEYGREVEDPAVFSVYEGASRKGEVTVNDSSILTKLGTKLSSFSNGHTLETKIDDAVKLQVLSTTRVKNNYDLGFILGDELFLIATDLEELNRLGNLVEEYGKVNYRFLRWSPDRDGNCLIPWKHEEKDEQPIPATQWEREGQPKDVTGVGFILLLVAAIIVGLVLMISIDTCTGAVDPSMMP